ncbi:hypothetical protein K435DRAFT_791561 [Dendrothele bispora CBS 962.96]|uniref:Uncharacterized protein n=1 Tax=Dendrothele bispora (strain CBS 962.96) TaxID=1314807 RepID=A0A4S8MLA6_DENBC|nr:hypothetical protein K435DRAFT_791561 [Dendrothele bispora CBS 962.96]
MWFCTSLTQKTKREKRLTLWKPLRIQQQELNYLLRFCLRFEQHMQTSYWPQFPAKQIYLQLDGPFFEVKAFDSLQDEESPTAATLSPKKPTQMQVQTPDRTNSKDVSNSFIEISRAPFTNGIEFKRKAAKKRSRELQAFLNATKKLDMT